MRAINAKIIAYLSTGVICVLATWIVGLNIVSSDYEFRLQQGQSRADELSSFFENDALKILTMADNFVREARRDYLKDPSASEIASFYRDAVPQNDFVSDILLIGPQGNVVAQPGLGSREIDLSQESFFEELRDNPNDVAYITQTNTGQWTGRLTLGLVRRVTFPDGTFGGAILAAINVGEFTEFFATVNLGPKSSATLVGQDKRIRARSTYGRVGPGQDISKSQIWKRLAESTVGSYQQTSVVDNITRFYSYRQMSDYPLVVAIGIAEEDIVQGARPFSQTLYAVMTLVSLVISSLIGMLCFGELARQRLQKEVEVRRSTEAKLEQANTNLAQFAYSASHDLKAPLSSIKGLLEFCVEDLESGDHNEVETNLNVSLGIADRAAQKVESLLRLAKTDHDDVLEEDIDLERMIADIWRDQSAYLDDRIRLETDIEAPSIVSEKAALQVILENIISNAIRYRDEQKAETLIRVSARNTQNETVLQISDNGVGIAPKDQTKVFEMFQRADDRSGDGLGLALVKKCVERIGANISLASILGEETIFTIKLDQNLGGT